MSAIALPARVAVKVNLCVLAYRELLYLMPQLVLETSERAGLSWQELVEAFCSLLCRYLHDADPATLTQATSEFGPIIGAYAKALQSRNAKAADLLGELADRLGGVELWDYREELEHFHDQGRECARAFYTSAREPIRDRLDKKCHLCHKFQVEPKWPKLAPMAYRASHRTLSDVVLNWLTYGDDFVRYLAYPYFFLHEYTAHVFRHDNNYNELFSDGWMLFAAELFLLQRADEAFLGFRLSPHQRDVFTPHLLKLLPRIPLDGYRQAQGFYTWLVNTSDHDRFMQITHGLAACGSQGEPHNLPTQFMNRLNLERKEGDQVRLLQEIQSGADVPTLYSYLLHTGTEALVRSRRRPG